MTFSDLVDQALETQEPVRAPVAVASVLDTKFDSRAYYVVNGSGLWRAERDGTHGVNLSRLFSGDRLYRTVEEWVRDCATGTIRQAR